MSKKFLFLKKMFDEAKNKNNWEGASFALYYAMKFKVMVNFDEALFETALESKDCVFMTVSYLYQHQHQEAANLKKHVKLAADLQNSDNAEEYWLYFFEVLPKTRLKGLWKVLKENKVSFILPEYSS